MCFFPHRVNAWFQASDRICEHGYFSLLGYEDTNDAERLSIDPAIRHVVGERAKNKTAASVSQMGWFETEFMTQPQNLKALMNQPGQWVDEVHQVL